MTVTTVIFFCSFFHSDTLDFKNRAANERNVSVVFEGPIGLGKQAGVVKGLEDGQVARPVDAKRLPKDGQDSVGVDIAGDNESKQRQLGLSHEVQPVGTLE